jgi:hypothetical protein
LELHWRLPYCSGQIDGTPAQAIPARASVALSTLKQSRYSIRFVDTVPFDVAPDPASPDEHWRGTLSYDATLSFSHRCIHQRNGTATACSPEALERRNPARKSRALRYRHGDSKAAAPRSRAVSL